jgi:hypothetical protein
MGPRTDAARAEVLAARQGLDEELIRLEAAGRAAVDIPARLRREPVKVLGTAGGAAFLLLGGPQRLFRRARRAILGPKADLPKSMLPKEIERELKKLGDDGDRVRATLEREFAEYLDNNAPARRERDLGALATVALGNVLKPLTERLGRQLTEEFLNPDGPSFADGLRRARERAGRPATEAPETGPGDGSGAQPRRDR